MNKIPGFRNFAILVLMLIASANIALAQSVEFVNMDTILEKFPEAQQAQECVQSITDEWKPQLDSMKHEIEYLVSEIEENSSIWTEDESLKKESELASQKKVRDDYTKIIFGPNGKFDQAVKTCFSPIEKKLKLLNVPANKN